MSRMIRTTSSVRTMPAKRRQSRRYLQVESLESRSLLSGFVDGFEGPSLNPFWSQRTDAGFITFPSTVRAHGGSQSVQFSSEARPRWISLYHDFERPVYGTVSVWIYDTGADVASSNYIELDVFKRNTSEVAKVVAWDQDPGPGQDGHTYAYFANTGPLHSSSIDRTQAWHKFEIEAAPNGMTFRVDGIVIGTSTNSGFDRVEIALEGLSLFPRPAWTAYYDDFAFVPYDPDLIATSLEWNSAGGVDFSYAISGSALTQDTTAALYWATGPTFADRIEPIVYDTAIERPVGQYGPIHVPAAALGVPPAGARYLLAVVDPDNTVAESDEPGGSFGQNNVRSLALPQEFEIKFMAFIPGVGGNYILGPSFHPASYTNFESYLRRDQSRLFAFAGDGRGFDPAAFERGEYRAAQTVTIIPDQAADADGLKEGSAQNLPGISRAYTRDALADGRLDANDAPFKTATVSTAEMFIDPPMRIGPHKVSVRLHTPLTYNFVNPVIFFPNGYPAFGGPSDALILGATSISWDFTITIDTSGPSPTWTVQGVWDGFPAAELYINDQPVFNQNVFFPRPGASGRYTLGDLAKLQPFIGDVRVNWTGTLAVAPSGSLAVRSLADSTIGTPTASTVIPITVTGSTSAGNANRQLGAVVDLTSAASPASLGLLAEALPTPSTVSIVSSLLAKRRKTRVQDVGLARRQ